LTHAQTWFSNARLRPVARQPPIRIKTCMSRPGPACPWPHRQPQKTLCSSSRPCFTAGSGPGHHKSMAPPPLSEAAIHALWARDAGATNSMNYRHQSSRLETAS
jgi:hypothetical protein